MINSLLRKSLVLGIIFFLVGMSAVPIKSENMMYSKSNMTIGDTFYVDDDYDENTSGWNVTRFDNIQDAINAAENNNYDLVLVNDGIYNENVIIDKSTLMLDSISSDNPIINGDGNVVHITADEIHISGFTVQNSGNDDFDVGILVSSNYNVIYDNTINDSKYGIILENSSSNHLNNNDLPSNGIVILGDSLQFWNTHIIEGNTANGRSIYYYANTDNVTVPEDSGQVILANCTDFTIQNLDISDSDVGMQFGFSSYNDIAVSNVGGIVLSYSDSNNIFGNVILNNNKGVYLHDSSENTIIENIISDHNSYGIYLEGQSSNNIIYRNNFQNNNPNAWDESSNIWDDATGEGNYWDDYSGIDGDGDGIGDVPYSIPGGSNQDNYPLIHPYGSITNLDTDEVFLTIQKAIDDTDTLNGHTIYVKNDKYPENVVIYKSINLIGENKETTLIDGREMDTVIHVSADEVNICNFTVQHSGSDFDNAGIKVCSANTTISQTTIENNTNGIYIYNSSKITIEGNTVSNNNNGFGIYLYASTGIIIKDNTIENNNDGIYLHQCMGAVLSENKIYRNVININDRYGIYLADSSGHLIKGNFVNKSTYGIYLYGSSNNFITRLNKETWNNFLGNDCGIYISFSSNDNTIYHNNFINSLLHNAYDECSNIWNIAYSEGEGGGNYWSDFDSPSEGAYDDYHGEYQNELGFDGIVDKGEVAGGGINPYYIPGGNNQDIYPLMYPYDDYTPPTVEITKPVPGLYLDDRYYQWPQLLIEKFPILSFLNNLILILGHINIEVNASDLESGMDMVEFYIDNSFKENVTTQPYRWEWKDWAFLRHTIKVIAYDKAGNYASADITVWKLF